MVAETVPEGAETTTGAGPAMTPIPASAFSARFPVLAVRVPALRVMAPPVVSVSPPAAPKSAPTAMPPAALTSVVPPVAFATVAAPSIAMAPSCAASPIVSDPVVAASASSAADSAKSDAPPIRIGVARACGLRVMAPEPERTAVPRPRSAASSVTAPAPVAAPIVALVDRRPVALIETAWPGSGETGAVTSIAPALTMVTAPVPAPCETPARVIDGAVLFVKVTAPVLEFVAEKPPIWLAASSATPPTAVTERDAASRAPESDTAPFDWSVTLPALESEARSIAESSRTVTAVATGSASSAFRVASASAPKLFDKGRTPSSSSVIGAAPAVSLRVLKLAAPATASVPESLIAPPATTASVPFVMIEAKSTPSASRNERLPTVATEPVESSARSVARSRSFPDCASVIAAPASFRVVAESVAATSVPPVWSMAPLAWSVTVEPETFCESAMPPAAAVALTVPPVTVWSSVRVPAACSVTDAVELKDPDRSSAAPEDSERRPAPVLRAAAGKLSAPEAATESGGFAAGAARLGAARFRAPVCER